MASQPIQIEKGLPLPLPPRNAERNGRYKYPFAQMEVGDSFAIPKPAKSPHQIGNSAAMWAKYNGFPDRKFSVRVDGATVRIWRVA